MNCRSLLLTLFLLVPSYASASDTVSPSEVVRQAIAELKNSGKVESLSSSVDWQKYYEDMDPEYRKSLKLHSADDVKEHFETKASSGAEAVIEDLKQQVREQGKANDPRAVAKIQQLETEARKQKQELKQRIVGTNYLIEETSVEDDTAEVKVKKVFNKTAEVVTLRLTKRNGQWKLQSAAPLSPSSANAAGSPIGATIAPQQVLFKP